VVCLKKNQMTGAFQACLNFFPEKKIWSPKYAYVPELELMNLSKN
jgi:hypothetical protein